MKFTTLIFFAVLLSTSAFSETINIVRLNNGDARYFVLAKENEFWRAQVYYAPKSQFQDLEAEKNFKTETSARRYVANYRGQHRQVSVTNQQRTGQPVWLATQTWSLDWEKKYSEWVALNIQGDFFRKYNVATDCADVAVALHWIFARIHGLPAANSMAGTGQIFSSQDLLQRWETLPTDPEWNKDQRFLAVLKYILSNTYTHSLMRDSYPVALNPDGLSPGTFYLYKYSSTGHTQMLISHLVAGVDKILIAGASTVPSKVRELDVYPLIGLMDRPKKSEEAFLRLRWPLIQATSVTLQPANTSPLFSEEQFDASAGAGYPSFMDYVYNKLNGHDVAATTWVSAYLDVLKVKWASRVDAVITGYNFCKANPCPQGSADFGNFATESRDYFISSAVQTMVGFTMESREAYDIYDSQRDDIIVTIEGTPLTLERLVMIWMNWGFSTDPNEPVRRRWGIN